MFKFTRDYVGKYLHFTVRVLPEAGCRLYAVFIDDAQRAEVIVQRTVVAEIYNKVKNGLVGGCAVRERMRTKQS
jgi:hypothetical protein